MAEQITKPGEWTAPVLRSLIAQGESELIEFKCKWYDFEKGEDKAKFVKDVLALANTARPEHPGLLLIGVGDKDQNGVLFDPGPAPEPETITQVLSTYTMPPVQSTVTRVAIDTQPIDVLTVSMQAPRPHYATRDMSHVLQKHLIYVRRGRTIGVATYPEIEAMIAQKYRDRPPVIQQEPITVGFVQVDHWRRTLVARVDNLTDEPLGDVHAMWDISMRAFSNTCARQVAMSGATLHPRRSTELELDLRNVHLAIDGKPIQPDSYVPHRLIDVAIYVRYRDPAGFLRTIQQSIALGG